MSKDIKNILVVDDVEVNQQLVKRLMERWGLAVQVAGNGKEALAFIETEKFDLIFMDIQMPEMDGLEATRLIRQMGKPKSLIPIVALTANLLPGDAEIYSLAGMNECLAKPFKENDLLRIITNYIPGSNNLLKEQLTVKNGTKARSQEKLYDLTLIESIAGGDKDFPKRMVGLFLQTMPAMVDELEALMLAKKWHQIGDLAHKMKSTIDSMGIASVKQDIRQLEKFGKSEQSIAEIPSLTQTVCNRMRECIKVIKEDFA